VNNPDRLTPVDGDYNTPKITVLDKALVFITHSMDPVPMIAILFALSTITLIMNKYYKDFFVKEMMLLIFSAAIPIVIGSIVKKKIGKPRPDQTDAKIIIKTNSSSWPSTHAAVAVGFYGFLAFLTIQNHLPIYTTILCTVMIILISYSRIHLNVHFFQDILGGLGLGLLVLAIMITSYYFAPRFAFSAKTLLALVIVSWFFIIIYYRKHPDEIPEIMKNLSVTTRRILTGSVVFIISIAAVWTGGFFFIIFMAIIAFICSWEISHANPKIQLVGGRLLGIIVAIIAATAIVLLRNLDHGRTLMIISVLSSTLSDVSGWGVGKLFGRTKIFGAVSPNKTLEGLIGAILAPVLIYKILIEPVFIKDHNAPFFLIIVLSISAVAGDYLESLLKRKLEIKDFSDFLSGHGGFCDRFDSALFTGLIFFLIMIILIILKTFGIY
jgi:phosphatidate cytidylyltransferase